MTIGNVHEHIICMMLVISNALASDHGDREYIFYKHGNLIFCAKLNLLHFGKAKHNIIRFL